MKRIGILGGSFDPVHIGHTALGNYVAQAGAVDEVWMMLSPQNPFKTGLKLTDDVQRMEMLRIATQTDPILRPCDIELNLPRPSYTIKTLRQLASMYPECRFKLIIGSDNWLNFSKWRESGAVVSEFGVIIYPRRGFEINLEELPDNVVAVNAPLIEVSSTWIREAISCGKDVNYFMPAGVYPYIVSHNLYRHD